MTLTQILARLIAQAPCTTNPKVWVLLGEDKSLYLCNMADADLQIGPCELFGFNTGSFSEMVTSKAKLSKDVINFPIGKDSDLIVSIDQGEKQLTSLAEFIFKQAGANGVMDVTLQDHNLQPMLQDHLWMNQTANATNFNVRSLI